eukprot:scaffold83483_cov66-Phaeocystis_antarctica.AAC.2
MQMTADRRSGVASMASLVPNPSRTDAEPRHHRKRHSAARPRPSYLDLLPDVLVFELCVYLERSRDDTVGPQHGMRSVMRLGEADRRCQQVVQSWALRNAGKPFTAAEAYLVRTAYQIMHRRAMSFLHDPDVLDLAPVEQWVQGRLRGLSMFHRRVPNVGSSALRYEPPQKRTVAARSKAIRGSTRSAATDTRLAAA